jgi:hypothetical protein
MNVPSSAYRSSPLGTFDKQLAAIERKDGVQGSRIRKKMNEILADPYGKIRFAAGLYRGRREDRVGKYRLIFVVCKQCRAEKHIRFNNCSDCPKTPDETIVWVMIIEDHKY